MNMVTACCSAGITNQFVKEYPLNKFQGIVLKTNICVACKEEAPEMVQVCDCCGEVSNLVETTLGYWCNDCIQMHTDVLTENMIHRATLLEKNME